MELATDMSNLVVAAAAMSASVHVALTFYYFARRAAEMI